MIDRLLMAVTVFAVGALLAIVVADVLQGFWSP